MAHEVETMAYANAVPWHGLGRPVSSDMTVDEMLVAAGLDWTVSQHPVFAQVGDDKVRVPNTVALMRDSDRKILTTSSENWHPLQNADALGFMRRYAEAGGVTMETAGALRGGRIVWSLAKLKHGFSVGGRDRVEGYLLITSPHEVGRAISIRTTTVRVVCANTLAMAEEAGTAGLHYRQNHTAEFDAAVAHQTVESANEQLAKAARRAETVAALKISAEDAVRHVFMPTFYPEADKDEVEAAARGDKRPRRIQAIVQSLLTAPGAEPGTGWGTLNAVTHWADHVSGRDQDVRLTNAWFGPNARAKLAVERLLLRMADADPTEVLEEA